MPFIKGGEGRRAVLEAPPWLRAEPWPLPGPAAEQRGLCAAPGPGRGQERTPKGCSQGRAAPPAQRVLLLLHGWVGECMASPASGQAVRLARLGSPCTAAPPKQPASPPSANNLHGCPGGEQLIINVEQSKTINHSGRAINFLTRRGGSSRCRQGDGQGVLPGIQGSPGTSRRPVPAFLSMPVFLGSNCGQDGDAAPPARWAAG